jgi:hypothetical protein
VSKIRRGLPDLNDPRHREPIDKAAALVTSKSSDWWRPEKKIDIRHWDVCPPTRPVPFGLKNKKGRRFGRFVVVGLEPITSNRTTWICRCDCGRFEPRTSKAIENHKNRFDMCHECRYQYELRRCHARLEFKLNTGHWPDDDFDYGRVAGI